MHRGLPDSAGMCVNGAVKGSRVEFSRMFAWEKACRQQLSNPSDICIKLAIKFIVEIKLLRGLAIINSLIQAWMAALITEVLGCGGAGCFSQGSCWEVFELLGAPGEETEALSRSGPRLWKWNRSTGVMVFGTRLSKTYSSLADRFFRD